jgi:PDZ domain/PEGA domain
MNALWCSHSLINTTIRLLILSMVAFPPFIFAQSTPPGSSPTGSVLLLEDGTPIKLRLSRTISSAEERVGNEVDFDVLEEIRIVDRLVIPKGSLALGTVTVAEEKKRMGRGGKLDINIDSVRLANGQKAALRAVKNAKGGGHVGAMTGAIVATSLVLWPAAPLFLLMHGKDITIPKGTEITAYVNGNTTLDPTRFGGLLPSSQIGLAAAVDTRTPAIIAITSTPAGAEISVDHNFVGNTPSSVSVSAGAHVVSVSKIGFKDWQHEIRVSGGTVSLIANLIPGSTRASVDSSVSTLVNRPVQARPEAPQDNPARREVETTSGWIGLSTEPRGANRLVVTQIVPDGPAERGGLKVGDILIELNRRKVTSGEDFDNAIAACKPGSKVQVTYVRRAWQLQATIAVADGTNP